MNFSHQASVHQQRRSASSEDQSWHALQRRNLHEHYSVSILDDTINRGDDGLQAAINRAIASEKHASSLNPSLIETVTLTF